MADLKAPANCSVCHHLIKNIQQKSVQGHLIHSFFPMRGSKGTKQMREKNLMRNDNGFNIHFLILSLS